MAHYEGETLKERIAKGPLEVADAIDIATQVGQGLAEAHGAGIVHRDIKPANLLVTKARVVKILDFGLAKLAGAEGMTQTGTTLGTVAYMSPEQLRGEDVDHRTDIWSLGVVLFEMVAGARPFKGERLEAVSVNILQSQPASLASSRTGVPADLERMVNRALVKPVADRYQTVADLLGELRKLQSSSTVVTPAQPDVPSIAVLPFVNMSADPEQEYFCEGMAEEIINALTALEGLHVASRTSAFKARDYDIAEVGVRLKVGAVLEGSVRKAGNRLRVTAQLIKVSDGYHLWSERYDRDMDDVFAVQDEIARSVVEKLKVKLLGASDEPLVKRATDNLEAYNLYLQGRYYLPRYTEEALQKALDCFEKALALEPLYARAHAGVAHVQTSRATLSLAASQRVMPEAKAAALRALAVDEELGEAHFALGQVLYYYEWDWTEGLREHRHALALVPGDVLFRSSYAQLLAQQGRVDESITEAQSAVERDPLNPNSRTTLAAAFCFARRFDEAIAAAQTGLGLDANHFYFYVCSGWALIGLGRHEEAVEACRHATNIAPEMLVARGCLGAALGLAGHRQEAFAILDDLARRESQGQVDGLWPGFVSAGLGNHDQAIVWLQQAADQREVTLPTFIRLFLVFDPLCSDPRFQALLRKMNFPAQG